LIVRWVIGTQRDVCCIQIIIGAQETALNHVWMSGLAGDGFGATRAMTCRNLIWVVTRMQVHVEQYPAWYVTDISKPILIAMNLYYTQFGVLLVFFFVCVSL